MFVRESVRLFTDEFSFMRYLKKEYEYLGENDNFHTFIFEGKEYKLVHMRCKSITEYCTEIHVMSDGEDGETLRNLLEVMRLRFNKDWVIADEDLDASILR